MKGNFKIIKDQALEIIFGTMEKINILDNGKMGKNMEMGYGKILKEISIQVNGLTTLFKDMECIPPLMDRNIKDIL